MSKLYSVAAGNGPDLLLLHGLFGDRDNLGRLGRTLEQDYRVIRADLPGHGESDSTDTLDLTSMANVMLELVADSDSLVLVGHSLGGKVVMQMAADDRCPPLEAMIVLDIAPRQYPPHHKGIFAGLHALDPARISSRREADDALSAYIDSPMVRAFLLKSLARDDDGNYRWKIDIEGLTRDYDGFAIPPAINAAITAPTLFLRGANSDYIQDDDWPRIQALFPAAELETIEQAGHWLHAEQPEQVAEACQTFLSRHR